MTTAYTSLLGLALPVQGELSGTWGDTVNNSITSLLDTSVAGTTNVSTDTDVTLTTTTGAANTARQAILLFSGARTALRTVTAPAQSKIYTVINATTGGFSVKLVGSGPTTGLTIPNGASAVVAWNGSDFVEVGAGSIGNLVVNGTLTVTGATTLQSTLAVTGNITNTAGTANGVLYLNGSKVVTSGSALTFDGTNLAVTGGSVTAGSTQGNAQLIYGSVYGGIQFRNNTTAQSDVVGDTSGNLFSDFLTSAVWRNSLVGTNELMRLTSTGLGIGTSSPYTKLQVTGTIKVATGNAQGILSLGDGNGSTVNCGIWRGAANAPTTDGNYLNFGGYDGLVFAVGNAAIGSQSEVGRFTSTGLGIGTSSPSQKLEVAGNMYINTSGNPYLQIKTSGSGNNPYIRMQADTNYWDIQSTFSNTNDDLLFQYNGTALLDLDKNGNLGLGVTPSAWGGSRKALQIGGNTVSTVGLTNTIGEILYNNFFNGTNFIYSNTGYASSFDYNNATTGGFAWRLAASGTAGNAITFTQAMTLDASGNLLVGTTSANAKVKIALTSSATTPIVNVASFGSGGVVSLGSIANNSEQVYLGTGDTSGGGIAAGIGFMREASGWNSALSFYTNNVTSGANGVSAITERARIDSSGNLLVGTTSTMNGVGSDGKIGLQSSGASGNFVVQNSGDDNIYLAKVSGYTNSTFIRFSVNGTGVGSVTTNGTNTTYATSSDYRLKNSIAPMTGALAKVVQLKPCTYKWNADGSDGEGFIAHELQAIIPDAVVGKKDAVNEDGSIKPQGIDTSFLVATLTAAIQEQQAIIESLKARLDAANL